jgi:hypothetical protein
MKYRILVSGRGSECYVHKISPETKIILSERKIENNEMDAEEIAEVLGLHFVTDSDDIVLGPYNDPEDYLIKVLDENDKVIWESGNDHEFFDYQFNFLFEDETILTVDDYTKGLFYTYELELEKDFDYKKLIPIVSEVSGEISVITDLMYEDIDLRDYKEYGDYWSKGITYSLLG